MSGGISSSSSVAMLFLLMLLSPANIHHAAAAAGGGNPANDLVALINAKRTASKLPPLRNSKGLGCMALQYISHCIVANANSCSATTTTNNNNTVTPPVCQAPDTDITEVYAANCGVELPTVDVISGRLAGCSTDAEADSCLADINMTVIRGKEHTQVGAGFDRARRHHGPFFWCLLFSSGSPNSTFQLEAAGKGITQTHGCFSAPDTLLTCNSNCLTGYASSAALPLLLFLIFLLS
ncbi:uncharacterized protein LOC100838594 isoform X2 [Brachypodium distachyon]|uniref:uncharacterized protein LOC100838594 isoform X2 n=1 Tax=Brachypodium distachyon TaxID=15368 RepID=UPI00071DBD3C|nr:uncharacterized protein LOC100838594 isoform X2 [Brachypodium distachyon]|eukprot:XP_014756319.1 uncharacterized protein LOC100838594 isoform X2 [Brachypodium distachyon]